MAGILLPTITKELQSINFVRVLFGKWSGTEVKIDGQELLIMKESDVMGVIVDTQSKKKAA